MNLKKSLFGGYKRNSVDAVIMQMMENNERTQEEIAILNNEFHLSKESAQKNLETLQNELSIKQDLVLQLGKTIETQNNRIDELEKQDEKYKTEIAKLEDDYKKFIQDKDEQIKKIGQLYVDAQENTEKIKAMAKTRIFDTISRIFHELNKTQEQFEISFENINQKKDSFSQIMREMIDTLSVLQNKADELAYDRVSFVTVFDNIKYAREEIFRQIENDFDNEVHIENNHVEPESEMKTKIEPPVNYSIQIEELRQKIERQEELLRSRPISVHAEQPVEITGKDMPYEIKFSNDEMDITDDPDSIILKKPSIKEILNKYSKISRAI
ncbi:MAG: coiled-coil domain-containing protein [Saccharofermentanales bacterium]